MLLYAGVGGPAYCAGLAVLKFDETTERGAKAVKALYAGLVPFPPIPLCDGGMGDFDEETEALMEMGGRAGSEDGGCPLVEDDWRPGGGGKDMMNGCTAAR